MRIEIKSKDYGRLKSGKLYKMTMETFFIIEPDLGRVRFSTLVEKDEIFLFLGVAKTELGNLFLTFLHQKMGKKLYYDYSYQFHRKI